MVHPEVIEEVPSYGDLTNVVDPTSPGHPLARVRSIRVAEEASKTTFLLPFLLPFCWN